MKKISTKKNIIMMLADKIIKIFVGFGISVMIARYLGSENLGKISYVLAFLGFFEVLSIFGMDSIILKEIGMSEDKDTNKILSSVMFFRVGIYILTLPIWYYMFSSFTNGNKELLNIFLIFSVNQLLNAFIVFKLFFQAKGLNKNEVIASQIAYFIGIILKIGFIVMKGSLYWYAILFLGEKVIYSIILLLRYKRENTFKFEVDFKYLKKIIKEALPLLLASVSIFVYMKVDQLMVGKMLSVKEVGVYSVGVKLSELVYFIPVTIATAYFPKILEEKKNKSKDEYINEFVKLGNINVFICMLFAIGATILGKWFIELAYGMEYSSAGNIFRIYSWAGVFVALGVSTSKYLVLEKQNNIYLCSTLTGGIVNFILNLYFIRKFGVIGAAWTTIISMSISTYFYYIFVNDKDHIKMRTKAILMINLKNKINRRLKMKKEIKKLISSILECFRIETKFHKMGLNDIDNKLKKYLNFNNGTFIEVGGNDGRTQSNTYFLEKIKGWSGLLVEGIPELYEKCKNERKKSSVYNYALVGQDFDGEDIEMEYANLMSVVSKTTLDRKEHIKKGLRCQNIRENYIIKVPTITLQELLDKEKIKKIDFLSLDVEGFELEVLKGINLNKVEISYMLIEIQNEKYKEKIERYLGEKYSLIEQLTKHDYLYKKKLRLMRRT